MIADDQYVLRQIFHQSLVRINDLREKEQKAIEEKRYDDATKIAYFRLEEMKRSDQILGQLTGAL